MPLPSNKVFIGPDGKFIDPNEFYVENLSSISFEVNGETFNLKGIGLLLTKSMPESTVKNLKTLLTRYFTNFVKSPMGRSMFRNLTTNLSEAMMRPNSGNDVPRWAVFQSLGKKSPYSVGNSAVFQTQSDVYTVYSVNQGKQAVTSGEFEGTPGVLNDIVPGKTVICSVGKKNSQSSWSESEFDLSQTYGDQAASIKRSQSVLLAPDEVVDTPNFRNIFTHETVHACDGSYDVNSLRMRKMDLSNYEELTQTRAMQIMRESDPTAIVYATYGDFVVSMPEQFQYNAEGRVTLWHFGERRVWSVSDAAYQQVLNGNLKLRPMDKCVITEYLETQDEIYVRQQTRQKSLAAYFKYMKEKYGVTSELSEDPHGDPVFRYYDKDYNELTKEEVSAVIKAKGGDDRVLNKVESAEEGYVEFMREKNAELQDLTDNYEIVQSLKDDIQLSTHGSVSYNPPLEESSTVCSGE